MANLLLFNKPFGVLSQFSDCDGHPGLGHYLQQPNIYAAGRLDHDSEGLLLLTDDGKLQAIISNPRHKLKKTYWAQVEGEITQPALAQLIRGVKLRDGITQPASAKMSEPPQLWTRNPPIRQRPNQPTSWIELQISEGKNRQVRRMTAATGFPTLRLIRVAIGSWTLGNLLPEQYRWETIHIPDTKHHRFRPKRAKW